MRSVTVTSLRNISWFSSNIIYFNNFTIIFRLDTKGFPMNGVFENYKIIAFEYFRNACVYFELNKYVL